MKYSLKGDGEEDEENIASGPKGSCALPFSACKASH